MRQVAENLRGLSVSEARVGLQNLNRRAAWPILLTLKQAAGNAINNFNLNEESLKIKEIQINKGPTLKRWRAVSRGRAREILKRSSHVRLILEGKKRESAKPQSKKGLLSRSRVEKREGKETKK